MKSLNFKNIKNPFRKKDKGEKKPIRKKDKAEKNSLLGKSLNVIGIIICVLLIPVLVVNGTLLVKSAINPNMPPDFMGYIPLVVGHDEMLPEFDGNDLVIVKTTENPDELEVGTIVSYWLNNGIVTSRIVDTKITELSDGQKIKYVTKGDANDAVDAIPVVAENVFAVYETHVDNIGSFVLFMQTPVGILTCVVLPLMIVFLAFYLIDKKRYKDALKRQNDNAGVTEQLAS